MRFEHLRITGFGPYADTQEIDFTALHAAGLFSVTGPTGAGKTTIFDALTYALYGSVPGPRNEANGAIRSHHLPPGDKTEVELGFTASDGHWLVRRSPEYERPKSRGAGTTLQRAAVSLHRRTGRGWEPVSGNKHEIDRRLAGIVGLRRDQFERVVLLPQGEFRRLLHARSRERRELFRTLFGTEAIERAVGELRERARTTAAAAATHRGAVAEQQADALGLLSTLDQVIDTHADHSIRALPSGHGEPELRGDAAIVAERLSARETEIRGAILPTLEALEHRRRLDAAAAVSARDRAVEHFVAIERRRELAAEISRLERAVIPAERDAVRAERARRSQPVVEVERRRQAATTEADVASAGAASAHAALAEAAAEAAETLDDPGPLRDRIQRRLQELDDLMAVAERLTAEQKRFADLQANLQRLSGEIADAERARCQADGERTAHSAVIADATVAGAQLAALDSALSRTGRDLAVARRRDEAHERRVWAEEALARLDAELVDRKRSITTLERERDSLAPAAAEIPDRRAALAAARRLLDEARRRDDLQDRIDRAAGRASDAGNRVAELSRRFVAGMAPRLAAELTAGEPCPVCGSCEHPAPARSDGVAVPVGESELHQATTDHLAAAAELAGLRATVDELTLRGDHSTESCEAAVRSAEADLASCEGAPTRIAAIDRELDAAHQRLDSVRGLREASAAAVTLEAGRVDEATAALEGCSTDDTARLTEHHGRLRDERDRLLALDQRADDSRAAMERLTREIADLDVRLVAAGEERAATLASSAEIGRTIEQLSDRLAPLGARSPTHHAADLTDLLSALDAVATTEARLVEARTEVERLTAERNRILTRSGIPDVDEAIASALPAEEIEKLEHGYAELTSRLTAATSALEQLDRLEIPAEAVDPVALSVAADAADQAAHRATEERIRVADLCDRARSSADRLRHGLRTLAELQAHADRAHRVASLCEGKGAARIGLEAFILRTHLEQVVRHANLRLDSISAGRYRLTLADSAIDGRNEWGLDLLVGDAHTGAQRDIRSLSGGETFYTSLALALGLSDVLSNRGATAVNAVFIDEGFGSLDPEVIDLTVDVLHQLHGDGVTVGVITHVEGVREAFGAGLVVERRSRGDSRIIQQLPCGTAAPERPVRRPTSPGGWPH